MRLAPIAVGLDVAQVALPVIIDEGKGFLMLTRLPVIPALEKVDDPALSNLFFLAKPSSRSVEVTGFRLLPVDGAGKMLEPDEDLVTFLGPGSLLLLIGVGIEDIVDVRQYQSKSIRISPINPIKFRELYSYSYSHFVSFF